MQINMSYNKDKNKFNRTHINPIITIIMEVNLKQLLVMVVVSFKEEDQRLARKKFLSNSIGNKKVKVILSGPHK